MKLGTILTLLALTQLTLCMHNAIGMKRQNPADDDEITVVEEKSKGPKARRTSSPLCDAIKAQLKPEIERLLAQGADVNEVDALGISAFENAVEMGDCALVEKILGMKCYRGDEIKAFSLACACGHENIVNFFLNRFKHLNIYTFEGMYMHRLRKFPSLKRAMSSMPPNGPMPHLLLAAMLGRKGVVDILITHGAPSFSGKEQELFLTRACQLGYTSIIQALVAGKKIDGFVKIFLTLPFDDPQKESAHAHRALENGHEELFAYIMRESPAIRDYVLFDFASKNNAAMVNKIMALSADQDHASRVSFEGALKGRLYPQVRAMAADGSIQLDKSGYCIASTPLCYACKEEDMALAKILIECKASVEAGCPLMEALFARKFDLAEFLLEKNADINVHGVGTPLEGLHGYRSTGTLLERAREDGFVDIVKFLIEHGARLPKVPLPLPKIMPRAHSLEEEILWKQAVQDIDRALSIARNLLKKNFFAACNSGDLAALKICLERGADINDLEEETQKTPFSCAVQRGHVEAARLLLAAAGQGFSLTAKDNQRKSALAYVIVQDSANLYTVIIEFARKHDMLGLLLHQIAYLGGKSCLELVLREKIDVNWRDPNQKTALMFATAGGHKECVEFLLQQGARVLCHDKDGKTALDMAKTPEIEKMLAEAGKEQLITGGSFLERICNGEQGYNDPEISLNDQDSEGKSLLIRTIERKSKAGFDYLMNRTALCTRPDKKGKVPLAYAVLSGDVYFVDRLCAANADTTLIKEKSADALYAIGSYGSREMHEYFINVLNEKHKIEKALVLAEFLFRAIRNEREELVKYLIEKGAILNNEERDALVTACETGNRRMVELLLECGTKPLLRTTATVVVGGYFQLSAPILGKFPEIRATVSHCNLYTEYMQEREKLNPDYELLVRLMPFIESDKLYLMIRLPLKEYLAQPEKKCAEFLEKYSQLRASFAHITGAELNHEWEQKWPAFKEMSTSTMGQTNLMWACIFGHDAIVQKLAHAGLPRKYFNEQDIWGRTALMYALLYGNFACAQALLKSESIDSARNKSLVNRCGAGINLRDTAHRNALMYAIQSGHSDSPRIMAKEDGTNVLVSAREYSQAYGALKAINTLLGLGAKLPLSNEMLLFLKIAASAGNKEIVVKILSICADAWLKRPGLNDKVSQSVKLFA